MAQLAFVARVPVWLMKVAGCKGSPCQQLVMNCGWAGSGAAELAKSFSLL